jgi:hypothetical protein
MWPIGICLFIVGVAFWLTCVYYQSKAKRLNAVRPLQRGRLLLAVLLLVGNFPAAAACTYIGANLLKGIYFDVINETGAQLDSCVLVVPGERQELKGLAAGGHFRTNLQPRGDGTADVIVTQGGRTELIRASGYVSNGMYCHFRVHVKPGLASDVETLR